MTDATKTLRDIREATGMSLRQFAANVDVSPSTITRIETGARDPSSALTKKLAPAYGLSVPAFWELLPNTTD